MSYLFENIYKYDVSKGSKAFSYFGVITKNYFIQKVKSSNKKNRTDVCFDKELIKDMEVDGNMIEYPCDFIAEKKEFMNLLKEEIKKWRSKFIKEHERLVLESIIILFHNPDLVDIHNKKRYLFIYKRNNEFKYQANS